MNRRELLFRGLALTALGVDGYFGWDLYKAFKERREVLADIRKTSPPPSEADMNRALAMVDDYARCEEISVNQQELEDRCQQIMRKDVREVYNAATIVNEQRKNLERVLKEVKPLEKEIAIDKTALLIGGGTMAGVVIGNVIFRPRSW